MAMFYFSVLIVLVILSTDCLAFQISANDLRRAQGTSGVFRYQFSLRSTKDTTESEIKWAVLEQGGRLAFRAPRAADAAFGLPAGDLLRAGACLLAERAAAGGAGGEQLLGAGCLVEDGSAAVAKAQVAVVVRAAAAAAGDAAAAADALVTRLVGAALDGGSRFPRLVADPQGDPALEALFARHGFRPAPEGGEGGEEREGEGGAPPPPPLRGDPAAGIQAYAARAAALAAGGDGAGAAAAGNVLGRLRHAAQDLPGAAAAYTTALEALPPPGEEGVDEATSAQRAALFRNLGSVYHSQGSEQMAFASYQQALAIAAPERSAAAAESSPAEPLLLREAALTYFKLGLLYESLARGKFEEAAGHAVQCFEFFLEKTGSTDTDVLTRLGNLQIKTLQLEQAVATYQKALAADPQLAPVWANLATAQMKLGLKEDAIHSLERASALDGALRAPRHLLAALRGGGGDEGTAPITRADPAYVAELFDFYSEFYEDHLRKKLLYTAPRILRQELRDMYNATFQALPEEERAFYNNDVLQQLNKSLTILDFGCGPALSGAWFLDYSRTLDGVDLSPRMVEKARGKNIYRDVFCADGPDFLNSQCDAGAYDLIVAADVFGYIGDLAETFQGAARALAPGGHLAFTAERATRPAAGGFRLEENARFAYTPAYLEALAADHGLAVAVKREAALTVERNEPVPGYLYVLRRPAAAAAPEEAEEEGAAAGGGEEAGGVGPRAAGGGKGSRERDARQPQVLPPMCKD